MTHAVLRAAARFAAFLAEFRERYVVGYEPTGKIPTSGWHRIDVRVKRPNVTVQARPGYQSRPQDVRVSKVWTRLVVESTRQACRDAHA